MTRSLQQPSFFKIFETHMHAFPPECAGSEPLFYVQSLTIRMNHTQYASIWTCVFALGNLVHVIHVRLEYTHEPKKYDLKPEYDVFTDHDLSTY